MAPITKEYRNEWAKMHPAKVRAWLYDWREKNKEKLRAIDKRYYEKNSELRKQKSREWYAKNKIKVLVRNRAWRLKNKAKVKIYRHNRELLQKKGIVPEAPITAEAIEAMLVAQCGLCALCESPMTENYTLDHTIPLNKGGRHAIYNIKLAHHKCNSMKQDKVREIDIQRAIMDYLSYKKVFAYRQNTGAFKTASGGFYHFGTPGAPDIVCVIKGQYVGIEVKAKGGKQSPNQKLFQKALEENGGKYILVYSIDELMKQI